MRRPSSTACHDGLQPVVGEDEVGGLPGHLGAAEPHRDTDVGQPQRGSVVDPVTGDRHHLARFLPGTDQGELLLRADPGEHRCCSQFGRDVADQVGTSPDRRGRVSREETDAAADGLGGRRVVTGHHRDPDAGVRERRQDRDQVVAWRIGQGDEPDEREIGGQLVADRGSASPRARRAPASLRWRAR